MNFGCPHEGPTLVVASHQEATGTFTTDLAENAGIPTVSQNPTLKRKSLSGTKNKLKMLLEDQRFIHEDLERLEQGVADRMGEEPKHVSFAPLVRYSAEDAYSRNRFAIA